MACRALCRLLARALVARCLVAPFALTACGRGDGSTPGPQGTSPQGPASAPSPAVPASTSSAASPPGAGPEAGAALAPSASSVVAALPTTPATRSADGSAAFCRAVRGPVELPIRGPATLVVRADCVDAVVDDDGRPRVTSFTAAPFTATAPVWSPPAREPAEGVVARGLRLQCATAGEVAFCPDRSGAIHRADLAGAGDRVVASGRTGTRIAASTFGGAHTALAYLASRKTTEGWVSEAWLEVDDDPPLRLSEDGSGATAVDLAARGGSLLALSIDARAALTAMHARPVAYESGTKLGEDAVVFVGGPGDRQTAGTLALPAIGAGWALLPIGRDIAEFGLAVVRLDDPPRVDEPTVWSMYPNGLDPAPVAVVARGAGAWVARVRPQAAEPGSARVLELGEVGADGAFTPRDLVPTADSPGDVSLALGTRGDLWLAWVDSSGSWVERLACR